MNINYAMKIFGLNNIDLVDQKILKGIKRKLSSKFHPDKECGSSSRMSEINAAFDLISNELKNINKNSYSVIDTSINLSITVQESQSGVLKNFNYLNTLTSIDIPKYTSSGTSFLKILRIGNTEHKIRIFIEVEEFDNLSFYFDNDLLYTININLFEAVYGTSKKIDPYNTGTYSTINIPEGTQSHSLSRLNFLNPRFNIDGNIESFYLYIFIKVAIPDVDTFLKTAQLIMEKIDNKGD